MKNYLAIFKNQSDVDNPDYEIFADCYIKIGPLQIENINVLVACYFPSKYPEKFSKLKIKDTFSNLFILRQFQTNVI
jgi:hypothetical protein